MFSGPPAPARRTFIDIGLVISIAGVALYALIVGWAILGERIAPERTYWLFALPCLVPAFWYLYGFLRADGRALPNRDRGLIFSAAGWFFVALTFLLKHFSSVAAASQGLLPEGGSNSPASWLFAFLSVACLVGGAVISSKYWAEQSSVEEYSPE